MLRSCAPFRRFVAGVACAALCVFAPKTQAGAPIDDLIFFGSTGISFPIDVSGQWSIFFGNFANPGFFTFLSSDNIVEPFYVSIDNRHGGPPPPPSPPRAGEIWGAAMAFVRQPPPDGFPLEAFLLDDRELGTFKYDTLFSGYTQDDVAVTLPVEFTVSFSAPPSEGALNEVSLVLRVRPLPEPDTLILILISLSLIAATCVKRKRARS